MPTPTVARADDRLRSELESLLLVAGGPVSVFALARVTGVPRAQVAALLTEFQRTWRGGIRLQLHEGEARLVTAPENVEIVHRYLGTARPPPLSPAVLEALTVVAYRQPVTRGEIEATRGANSDRAVQTLLARGLIEERGPKPTLGRPMRYGTTFGFLEYFGLDSLDDLPPVPDEEDLDGRRLGWRRPSPAEAPPGADGPLAETTGRG